LHNENIRESKDKGSLEDRVVVVIGNFMKNYKANPDEEEELYGTSPRVIYLLMLLVTLLFPVGFINTMQNYQLVPTHVYSGLWLEPLSSPLALLTGFLLIMNPLGHIPDMFITVPLSAFNFLFIRQVNRFFQGETSRDIVLMLGLSSMLLPSAMTLALWSTYTFQYVVSPIPIQFFFGLVLLYKFREPEVLSPWKGFIIDWSWWTRLRFSVNDPDPEVINLTQMLMEHDADWLEGFDD